MNKKILLVDDSNIVLSFHSMILENAGYVVDKAVNGKLGVEKILKEHFDLIITDINMAPMDGFTFIKQVRELDGYKNVPIVIVSTEKDESEKRRGVEVGADLFITKPAKKDELILKINMLLGR